MLAEIIAIVMLCGMMELYNSLTRKKEIFTPQDNNNIRMYVCGPTVYDSPHIGNARAVVVYDVLFRVLRHLYGVDHVTYARNITDVDDKIIAAAKQRNIPISQLTEEVTAAFHKDMAELNCLEPTYEPRATQYMPQMIAMIEKLLAAGNAYESQKHILFDITSHSRNPNWHYGMLSGRKVEDLIAGARVEVESYKRNAGDFVLWKPAATGDDPSSVFDSPWGKGRPGWHIECSAMSTNLLGENFDIHGGGADLKFPHHENEIAQSCCANPHSNFARVWVHNGFLTVNGDKMSKSLGNFITVRNLLDSGVKGEVIRLALLSAKYNEPLNWTDKLLNDAKKTLDGWYRKLSGSAVDNNSDIPECFITALTDDMNLPKAFAIMHEEPKYLHAMGAILGLLQQSPNEWFKASTKIDEQEINKMIAMRNEAKQVKNWAEADRIRDELKDRGVILEDRPDGSTDWRHA